MRTKMTRQLFDDIKVDLYRWLATEGQLQEKTSHDYISRLSFLAKRHRIDETLTEEKISEIMEEEERERLHREVYNSKHAMGDFRACLRKVVAFSASGYRGRKQEEMMAAEDAVRENEEISQTERRQIIQARVGQGKFRHDLIEYWHGCAVSGCTETSVMVASHIKPWRDADNKERMDLYNGLLLLPNYDKLFDTGLMTFDPSGKAFFSSLLDPADMGKMGIVADCRLLWVEEEHKRYLEYHNTECFIS